MKIKDMPFDTTADLLADGSLNRHLIAYVSAFDFEKIYDLTYDMPAGYKFYVELDTTNIEILKRSSFRGNKLYVTQYHSIKREVADDEAVEALPLDDKLIAISKDGGKTWKFLMYDKKYSGKTLKTEFPRNVIRYLLAGE
nr:hypothetical protein [uncultured Dyadobacter sp.]